MTKRYRCHNCGGTNFDIDVECRVCIDAYGYATIDDNITWNDCSMGRCLKCGKISPMSEFIDRVKCGSMYNHMFDVAFTIETPKENPADITYHELVDALRKRLEYLEDDNNNEGLEVFGHCDVYKVDD